MEWDQGSVSKPLKIILSQSVVHTLACTHSIAPNRLCGKLRNPWFQFFPYHLTSLGGSDQTTPSAPQFIRVVIQWPYYSLLLQHCEDYIMIMHVQPRQCYRNPKCHAVWKKYLQSKGLETWFFRGKSQEVKFCPKYILGNCNKYTYAQASTFLIEKATWSHFLLPNIRYCYVELWFLLLFQLQPLLFTYVDHIVMHNSQRLPWKSMILACSVEWVMICTGA